MLCLHLIHFIPHRRQLRICVRPGVRLTQSVNLINDWFFRGPFCSSLCSSFYRDSEVVFTILGSDFSSVGHLWQCSLKHLQQESVKERLDFQFQGWPIKFRGWNLLLAQASLLKSRPVKHEIKKGVESVSSWVPSGSCTPPSCTDRRLPPPSRRRLAMAL
jgi:hypothetical protein